MEFRLWGVKCGGGRLWCYDLQYETALVIAPVLSIEVPNTFGVSEVIRGIKMRIINLFNFTLEGELWKTPQEEGCLPGR